MKKHSYTALKTDQLPFELLHLKTGEQIQKPALKSSLLLCFIEGETQVAYNSYSYRNFSQDHIILIPKEADLKIKGDSQNARILIINCKEFAPQNFNKLHLEKYAKYKKSINYDITPAPTHHLLQACLNAIINYMEMGITCNELCKLKFEELAICFEYCYQPHEIACLFHPIINKDSLFRNFIIENYNKVTSVEELIEISNMCRTSFFKKFKEEFGVTAKQWILQQKLDLIANMIDDPKMRIKDIIYHFNFASHDAFYAFCRRHFRCTPSELKISDK